MRKEQSLSLKQGLPGQWVPGHLSWILVLKMECSASQGRPRVSLEGSLWRFPSFSHLASGHGSATNHYVTWAGPLTFCASVSP